MSTQPPMSEPIIENPEGTVSRTEIRNKRKAQKKVAKTEKIAGYKIDFDSSSKTFYLKIKPSDTELDISVDEVNM